MTQSDPENPSTEIFCPVCQKFITIFASQTEFNSPSSLRKQIYLHGSPLHAIIIFSNSTGQVMAHEISESIQFMRDARVITQLISNFHYHEHL
jgi:hypothetical protein